MTTSDRPIESTDATSGQLVAPPTTLADAPKQHLGTVDWLRIAGITGVIWYHALPSPSSPIAPVPFMGLHVLTAVSTFFAASSRSATLTDGQIIRRRAERLLIPWLFFGLLHIGLALRSHHFQKWMLICGGSMHLWFLPYIFIASCAIAMSRRREWIKRSPVQSAVWTALGIALLALDARFTVTLPNFPPTRQIANVLSSSCFGVAFFCLPKAAGWFANVAVLLAIAVGGGVAWSVGGHAGDARYATMSALAAAAGSILFGIARLIPIRANAASLFFGRVSFGIYLIHGIFLLYAGRLFLRLAHGNPSFVASSLMLASIVALTAVASIATVAIIERTPFRRLVGV